jgi:hypothetical protein
MTFVQSHNLSIVGLQEIWTDPAHLKAMMKLITSPYKAYWAYK